MDFNLVHGYYPETEIAVAEPQRQIPQPIVVPQIIPQQPQVIALQIRIEVSIGPITVVRH